MAAQFSNDIDSDLHSWLQDVIETSTELMGQLNGDTITITDDNLADAKALRVKLDDCLDALTTMLGWAPTAPLIDAAAFRAMA